MVDLIWFFLPMIVILGIVTSYTDIKHGKIRNKWIIIALAYSLVVYLSITIYLDITGTIQVHYLIETLASVFLSLFVAVLFWIGNYWSAADGKLFVAFSALIPLSIYNFGYVKYFPAINILINSFFVVSIVLLFQMIKKGKMVHYKSALKGLFSLRNILQIFAMIFLVHWIIKLVFSILNVGSSLLVYLVLIMLLFPLLTRVLLKNKLILYLAILSRLLLDRSIFNLGFIKEYGLLTLLYFLVMIFIIRLGSEVFSTHVKIKDIKEGMVFADCIIQKGGKYVVSSHDSEDSAKYEHFIEVLSEGISSDQLQKLRGAHKDNLLVFEKVRVLTHTYFAPHLFIGAILTIMVKGNILVFIRYIFS